MVSAAAVLAVGVWHLDPTGQVLTVDLLESVVVEAAALESVVAALELAAAQLHAVQEAAVKPVEGVGVGPLLPAVDSTAEQAEVAVVARIEAAESVHVAAAEDQTEAD